MTNIMSFEDRGRAFETKFALDKELEFKIAAKTTHLVAQWAADRIGLKEDETLKFVKELTELSVSKGTSEIKQKLMSDFSSNKVDISENALERLFLLKNQQARKTLTQGHAA